MSVFFLGVSCSASEIAPRLLVCCYRGTILNDAVRARRNQARPNECLLYWGGLGRHSNSRRVNRGTRVRCLLVTTCVRLCTRGINHPRTPSFLSRGRKVIPKKWGHRSISMRVGGGGQWQNLAHEAKYVDLHIHAARPKQYNNGSAPVVLVHTGGALLSVHPKERKTLADIQRSK